MSWTSKVAKRKACWVVLAAAMGCLLVPLVPVIQDAARIDAPAFSSRPYQLVAADGRLVPLSVLRARPTAWIFGFTQCGAPCEALLERVDELGARLGEDAAQINFVFVTIDPTNDPAGALRTYLSGHAPQVVALLGTQTTARHMANHFRVSYSEELSTGEFAAFADLTRIFLTSRSGKLIEAVELDETLDTGIAEIRRVMATGEPQPPVFR